MFISKCKSNYTIFVTIYISAVPVCNNTDIRLVGGRYNLEGQVEICLQGLWMKVCNKHWDTRAATVVCRQLGLKTESKGFTLSSVYCF